MAVVADVDRESWTPVQRAAVVIAVVTGALARWWALGAAGLTFDEAFTGVYARLPLSDLPAALRAHDAHPPLDYLLRHPVAGEGSEWLLRAPSALFATGALVLVAIWMRRRAWWGVGAVVLFAASPFELLHAREARMYALLGLLGVATAMLSERWLRGDRRPWVLVGAAALVALACLDHAGGLFLAVGVGAVAGLRTDADAWRWRLVPVGALAVWGVVWGTSFLAQAEDQSSSWVPLTTPGGVADVVAGLVSFVSGTRWLAAALVVAGVACTWVLDRSLGRVAVCLFGVPLALLAVVGLENHVLLSRALAASSWVAPVGLAALVTWLWQRRVALGAAAAVLVAVLVVRSLPRAVAHDEGTSAAVAEGLAAVAPGDGLFVHPAWWWPLAAWNGADGDVDGGTPPAALEGRDGWYWMRPGAAPSGRTWVLRPGSYRFDTASWPSCAPPRQLDDGWVLDCVVTGGS